MLKLMCTLSMFQGLPEQERQQLTEQLALKEKEKVRTHKITCMVFLCVLLCTIMYNIVMYFFLQFSHYVHVHVVGNFDEHCVW